MSKNPKKDTALRHFSRYIRIRDALKTTGSKTHAKCITCGAVQRIEDMDAGHALAGRNNAILFSEDLCHAQCRICNRFHGGMREEYQAILIAEHGPGKWEEWEALKHAHVKFAQADYEELAAKYRQKTKELMARSDE